MEPVEATHLTIVGQGGGFPYVTSAGPLKPEFHGLIPQSQDPTPKIGFDLMSGSTLLSGPLDIPFEIVQGVIHSLEVAIGARLLHLLHDPASVCWWNDSVQNATLTFRRRFFQSAGRSGAIDERRFVAHQIEEGNRSHPRRNPDPLSGSGNRRPLTGQSMASRQYPAQEYAVSPRLQIPLKQFHQLAVRWHAMH